MEASLSILLAVIAQAAAAPPPPCNPPCVPGQYCALDGRCYVPAPPQQQPPPGHSPSAQQAAPPGYYPPAQQAAPPGYYPPAQQAAPPGYDPPAPNPPPTGAAYAQPVARPAESPVAAYPPPARPPRYKQGSRFGFFLGGIALPDDVETVAFAGGLTLTFGSADFGFESRIFGVGYFVTNQDTKTNGGAVLWHGTRWWGLYGLGFGSGLGYADFTANSKYGWKDSSGQLLAYVAPVMLRFGRQPTFELGLNSGATWFFSHDVRPFGYLYGGLMF